MGFGFRKRKGLLGGLLSLNFSKGGVGASLGVPGARVGIDSHGRTYSRFGIPGTGLFYRAQHHHGRARDDARYGFVSLCLVALVIWLMFFR